MSQDGPLWRAGTSEVRFRGAKNSYKWNPKIVCEVHGSRVIREEHAEAQDLFDQSVQRSLAREIFGVSVEALQDFSGETAIEIRSDDDPGTNDFFRDQFHRSSETLGRPALGRSVLCSRADSKHERGSQ